MNNLLRKALETTLENWNNLSLEQRGKNFEDSVNRLTKWLNEMENSND